MPGRCSGAAPHGRLTGTSAPADRRTRRTSADARSRTGGGRPTAAVDDWPGGRCCDGRCRRCARARRLVRTAVAADAADEARLAGGPGGRVDGRRGRTRAALAAMHRRTAGMAGRPARRHRRRRAGRPAAHRAHRRALRHAAGADRPARSCDAPAPAATARVAATRPRCTHDLSGRPGLGPPGRHRRLPAVGAARPLGPGPRPALPVPRLPPAGAPRRRARPRPPLPARARPAPANLAGYCTGHHRGKHQAPAGSTSSLPTAR